MVNIQLKNRRLLIFGIPTLLFLSLVFLIKSTALISKDLFNLGVTIDFLFTVPLAYYLLIRKTTIPKTTIVPVIVIGFLIGSNILPETHQTYFALFKRWGWPVLELSVLILVVVKVSNALRRVKNPRTDFFISLKNTCNELFPKSVATFLIAEISVVYYGFFYWKKRKLDDNEFSYHKESGTLSLLFAILLIVTIETVVAHILLSKWTTTAAWIFTFLSIYSGIQIFGFLRSMLKRPYKVKNGKLLLTYGIMNETEIALNDIDTIELSSKTPELEDDIARLSFFGTLENHNVIIRLKKEGVLHGIYGRKKNYRTLLLHVDKKAEFEKRIGFSK